ncbi:photosynthetic complex assembly protein PuhC [Afifella pfennigii]|uniref:photosynthetic complex assembly protein PuhC n=1 Tax=Afifella pfennigii TaxID=209897 RepID=UPI000689E54C|nr:photosynthetic complex assembly protein PuhC [Afifella pfennigii]
MSRLTHPAPFPRGPLIAVGILVGAAILLAAVGQYTGFGKTDLPQSTAVEERQLIFVDQEDGGVGVYDADSDDLIAVMEPGTNGFLRATLRGLARERKLQGLGQDAPFRLTHWADGRLSLEDTATGRRLELHAFGPTNAQVFARLLGDGSQVQ